MAEGQLTRRSLLRIGWGGSVALLAGCSRQGPTLAARRGDLPERWLRQLPRDWRLRWLEGAAQVRQACGAPLPERPAMVQLSDGWATSLPLQAWAPFAQAAIFNRLDASAASASRLFAGADQPPRAFPWSLNPWVLVLRDRPELARQASRGWDLLLDPSLTGRVVLPSNPRVVMALVGDDPQRLCRLRRQVLAQDDRHGLHLLLSGPAQAAVLPRQQVIPLLRRDPRLTVLLPDEGAPIAWSLLLLPAGVGAAPPADWLEAILQPPLLQRLLAAGWVPPLPRTALAAAVKGLPSTLAKVLLPAEAVLQRCRALPPLEAGERDRLQEIWTSTFPCQAGGG